MPTSLTLALALFPGNEPTSTRAFIAFFQDRTSYPLERNARKTIFGNVSHSMVQRPVVRGWKLSISSAEYRMEYGGWWLIMTDRETIF